jgi:acetyl-CoA carboxylase carboxyl transferase alpha subunit
VIETPSAWTVVQRARHERRPYALDLARLVFDDLVELHGDRLDGDDPALAGGLALLRGRTVVLLAQQKGRTQAERLFRNYGMAHPEGYRKAMRLMRQAERMGVPVICLIDTPGAYPGQGAEARGQAWAIAECLHTLLTLRTPTLAAIVGEGGSGGALALAATDRVLAFEHAIYSVASPEACASILFRDSSYKMRAASALRLTAADAVAVGMADRILPEPGQGAHESPEETAATLEQACYEELVELARLPHDELLARRQARYRQIGAPRG